AALSPEDLQKEAAQEVFEARDEYLEMVMQFGFCTMFAVAFPLAPLFGYLNNRLEYHLDVYKLQSTRRPPRSTASTIGSWQMCMK
ncbi:unnamed protein product, partial [Chrysoparadoxa australica]